MLAILVLLLALAALALWALPTMRRQRAKRRRDSLLSSIELVSGPTEPSVAKVSETADEKELRAELCRIVAAIPGGGITSRKERGDGRFEAQLNQLVFGKSIDSVMPIAHFMHVEERLVNRAADDDDDGVSAVEAEFAASGTADDRFCLEYVLRGATGDASGRQWNNGVLDAARPAGLTLDDFARSEQAVAARLSRGHVLALRLYTTAAFASLNNPLRDPHLGPEKPHPFPVTVHLLTEAIKRLRRIEGEQASRNERVVL